MGKVWIVISWKAGWLGRYSWARPGSGSKSKHTRFTCQKCDQPAKTDDFHFIKTEWPLWLPRLVTAFFKHGWSGRARLVSSYEDMRRLWQGLQNWKFPCATLEATMDADINQEERCLISIIDASNQIQHQPGVAQADGDFSYGVYPMWQQIRMCWSTRPQNCIQSILSLVKHRNHKVQSAASKFYWDFKFRGKDMSHSAVHQTGNVDVEGVWC